MDGEPITGPELDYAFLAEFARTENGTITSVGASYTQLATDMLPTSFKLYVAGRFRAPKDGEPFDVDITFGLDGGDEVIQLGNTFDPSKAPDPYQNKVGLTFAVGIPATISNEGLHVVEIFASQQSVRRLYFEVTLEGQGSSPGGR